MLGGLLACSTVVDPSVMQGGGQFEGISRPLACAMVVGCSKFGQAACMPYAFVLGQGLRCSTARVKRATICAMKVVVL
eukprot:753197-Pelagomonas_calceolata.AAC.6